MMKSHLVKLFDSIVQVNEGNMENVSLKDGGFVINIFDRESTLDKEKINITLKEVGIMNIKVEDIDYDVDEGIFVHCEWTSH